MQVYPKPFDIFNIALYGSMIPLALLEHDWLLMYVGLLTNGTNAAFMWVSGWRLGHLPNMVHSRCPTARLFSTNKSYVKLLCYDVMSHAPWCHHVVSDMSGGAMLPCSKGCLKSPNSL